MLANPSFCAKKHLYYITLLFLCKPRKARPCRLTRHGSYLSISLRISCARISGSFPKRSQWRESGMIKTLLQG